MNTINLTGNVGQHPILRYTNVGTPVVNFSLATNRVYRDKAGERQETTEWHRLVLWGDPAETLAKIVGKGDLLAVRGRLEYKAREIAGEKVQDAVVRVLEWNKLSRKAQPNGAAASGETTDTGEPATDPGDLGEASSLEAEIEGGPFEGEEVRATDFEPAEASGTELALSTDTAPGEAPPAEPAPELDIPFPKTRGRNGRKK